MKQKGILIIISGFSGAGKGTVVKELVNKYNYSVSTSATTRKPRDYETHGKEYYFVSKEEFESMIEKNDLIEYAEYCQNYYGTPLSYVQSKLDNGEDVILEIEMVGALLVKKKIQDALLIFISPPSIGELKNRLVGRGTEDMDTINKRLCRAYEETDVIGSYDYIIINDSVDICVEDINSIITTERNRTFRNYDLIDRLKLELNNLTKGEM